MSTAVRPLNPLVRVVVPVAVAAGLIALALINLVVVKNWQDRAAVDDTIRSGANAAIPLAIATD